MHGLEFKVSLNNIIISFVATRGLANEMMRACFGIQGQPYNYY